MYNLLTNFRQVLLTATGADASVFTDFLKTIFDVLKYGIGIVGVGFLIAGGMSIAEGQSQENAAAKTQGWKQVASGVVIILLGFLAVPKMYELVQNLIGGSI